jgi:nucleotide-binding universal stress UspA family protein
MFSSILLYLEDEVRAESAIRLTLQLAKQTKSRIRGITLIDTRQHEEAHTHESAAFATLANAALRLSEHRQQVVRHRLSEACLEADVNFDIRKYAGDPVKILTRESRFHDLVVASGIVSSTFLGLTARDLIGLVHHGSNPVLLLQPHQPLLNRVLLVYDGTEAAGRAIRSYLRIGPLVGADHRLLAIGKDPETACEFLHEMGEYCKARCPKLEYGYVVGEVREIILPYINKWQADLVVVGHSVEGILFRRLFSNGVLQLLRKTSCASWVSA